MREVYRDTRSIYLASSQKRYGLFKFMGDIFMTFLTAGLWLIWIFVREMRNR